MAILKKGNAGGLEISGASKGLHVSMEKLMKLKSAEMPTIFKDGLAIGAAFMLVALSKHFYLPVYYLKSI